MKSEVNPSNNYRRDQIEVLTRLSKYNDNKPFKDLIRSDIISFLETLRKTETHDPMHKWNETYNVFRIYPLRFFKWLYYSDIEPDKRLTSSVFGHISKLKRKEESIYKSSDLWTQEDDCPSKETNVTML